MRTSSWFLAYIPFVIPLTVMLCACGSTPVVASPDTCHTPVMTAQGAVRGVTLPSNQVCRWTGLPYGAPPVGDRRWRPPVLPSPWTGVRDGSRFGARCYQKGIMELANFDPSHQMSEDCLNLNVWAPPGATKLPVMVWYHGGGLYGGTANTPMYHGDTLAAFGPIVYVSVNYRLNIFGYLATEALIAEDPDGAAGNYGVLDQIAALKWVRQNIAAFGGDPSRVTILGQSAGGWSVCNLMASPLAKGLFHRAIMMSGGCQAASSMPHALEIGARVEEALDCDGGDLACLRDASARKVIRKGVLGELHGMEWQARVDGHVIPEVPLALIAAGRYNRVPLIAGYVAHEADLLVWLTPWKRLDGKRRMARRLARAFGEPAVASLQDLYPLEQFRNPWTVYKRLPSEVGLICPTLQATREAARHEPNTWLYRVDFQDVRLHRLLGGAHVTDTPVALGTMDRWPLKLLYGRRRARRAQPLSERMMRAWTQFAATGNPNGAGDPPWRPLGEGMNALSFDHQSREVIIGSDLMRRCDYWRTYVQENPWVMETMGVMGRHPGLDRAAQPPNGQ